MEHTTAERQFKPCKDGQHNECAGTVRHPTRYLSDSRTITDISLCICECHDSLVDEEMGI